MTVYSFDTSVLVDAQRWYPQDTHPSFWQRLEALATQGRLLVSDMVITLDLPHRDDDVYRWCHARQGILSCPTDAAVQTALEQLANHYPNFGQGSLGKNQTDPFVVAVAMSRAGAVVATHESRSGNMHGPKMPDVCDHLGIQVLRIQEVVRAEGWVF